MNVLTYFACLLLFFLFINSYEFISSSSDRNVKMYTTDEVVPIMKRAIDEITEVLAVPTAAAQPLLRHHKWLKDRLFNAYTDDAEKETKAAGVFFRCGNNDHNNNNNEKNGRIQSKNHQHQPQCDICFSDELEPNDMLAMSCGHEFCKVCWSGHIKAKLETGPAAILATCPQHKCTELFTEDEVAIAAPDLLAKYQGYQLRNFVEMNGKSRWCPGAGCDRIAAIQSTNGNLSDAETVLVTCNKCTTCFCLKCGNEPHSPLSCATLVTWNDKCKNESETANWILANTKPCPNCRARIEKNQGCNHMTCQHCNYHFCWICSGDWKEHGANTGGYYNCNKFDDTDNAEEDQSDAAKAKRELDRYLHYYKRYHAHAEAQKYAMKQLDDIGVKMMALQECQSDSTWSDVEFLKTANEQLVACRRVLKFTYVFGYYMTTPVKKPESKVEEASTDVKPLKGKRKASSKDTKTDNTNSIEEILSIDEQMKKMRKERFEYHQEMLERFTENLSEMVEKSYKDIDRTEVVNQVSFIA